MSALNGWQFGGTATKKDLEQRMPSAFLYCLSLQAVLIRAASMSGDG